MKKWIGVLVVASFSLLTAQTARAVTTVSCGGGDDTAALTTALGSGSVSVLIPTGTPCVVDPVWVYSNTSLEIEGTLLLRGEGAAVLMLDSDHTGPVDTVAIFGHGTIDANHNGGGI